MSQLFYSNMIDDSFIILPIEEASHAIKVLRKNKGDIIDVTDGKGNLYHTLIENDDINRCTLKIVSVKENYGRKDYFTHIAISPPKSHDRLELFIEKSVEIGIHEISFIMTEYSERNNIKLNRILKRSISAMKQSLNIYLPKINDIVDLDEFINNCNNNEKYIAHQGANNHHLVNSAKPKGDYCILIGPEGGFSDFELANSFKYQFKPVILGLSRLRTETAAISACHILNLINELNV